MTTARQTFLDSPAKDALRKHVRRLRALLLDQVYEAARGEYRLDANIDKANLLRRALDQALKDAAHTWLNRLM